MYALRPMAARKYTYKHRTVGNTDICDGSSPFLSLICGVTWHTGRCFAMWQKMFCTKHGKVANHYTHMRSGVARIPEFEGGGISTCSGQKSWWAKKIRCLGCFTGTLSCVLDLRSDATLTPPPPHSPPQLLTGFCANFTTDPDPNGGTGPIPWLRQRRRSVYTL